MESVLVNARVPQAKKEAASGVLERLGSTTSELINSAYDYLLAREQLPRAEAPRARSRESFKAFVSESTLDIDWSANADQLDYKEMIRAGRQADYESLA